MLRGRKEPTSLRFSDFRLYVKLEGPYAGRECLSLNGLNADKTMKLTLQNPILRNEDGFHDMIAVPEDPLCIVKLFKMYRRHFPENFAGTILRREVPRKYLKNLPVHSDGFQPRADTVTNGGAFGINYVGKICEMVQQRCHLEGKRTAAGRRRAGITQQSCAGIVPQAELMKSARHRSIATTAEYQAKNEISHSLRHKAMAYDPSLAAKRAGIVGNDNDTASATAVSVGREASPPSGVESPLNGVEKKRIAEKMTSTQSTPSSQESIPEQYDPRYYFPTMAPMPPPMAPMAPMQHPMMAPMPHMYNPATMMPPAPYGAYYHPMMQPMYPQYLPARVKPEKKSEKRRSHYVPAENPYKRSNKKRL